jgi:hypothetical protein
MKVLVNKKLSFIITAKYINLDGSESNVTPKTTILPIDEEYEYEEEEILPSATTINSLSSVSKIATTTTTPVTSIITGAQCGSAPDYLPCISEDVANVRMLSCCQSKMLPAGCLDLCRYNTTRPEVIYERGNEI